MHYFLGFALLLLMACQGSQQLGKDDISPATSDNYEKALKRSLRPKAKMIYRKLHPISKDNSVFNWDAEGRVLLAGLSSWNAYNDQAGNRIAMGNDFWVVPAKRLRQYVEAQRQVGRFSTDRLLQKMGKAPSSKTFWVLEVWVAPEELFRPCPDAGIEDAQCQLDFPTDATAEHKKWFAEQQEKFKDKQLLWSRLGYTYDWGKPQAPFGFSEYVVRQRAEMKLETVTALEEYNKGE